jgi:hypothetical protein
MIPINFLPMISTISIIYFTSLSFGVSLNFAMKLPFNCNSTTIFEDCVQNGAIIDFSILACLIILFLLFQYLGKIWNDDEKQFIINILFIAISLVMSMGLGITIEYFISELLPYKYSFGSGLYFIECLVFGGSLLAFCIYIFDK